MPSINQNYTDTSGTFKYFFTEEILNMMHSFGDHSKPMPESAQLIESIVHEQLTVLLDKANKIADIRNSPVVGAEDILFLMRKDKSKLVRLINHLYVKDIKSSISAQINAQPNVQQQQQTQQQQQQPQQPQQQQPMQETDVRSQQNRRVRICYDYMSQLDEFGEYKKVFNQALFDEIKNQRLRRIDLMTRNMTQAEYLRFTKARQISFMSKVKPAKFSDWLLSHSPHVKVNLFAFEIIQYLAHETVAQIIDMSLLVKQDEEREPGDPISALITKSFYNNRDRIVLNSANNNAYPFAGGVNAARPTSNSVMYSQSAQQNAYPIGSAIPSNIQCVINPNNNLWVNPDQYGAVGQGCMYTSDINHDAKRRKMELSCSYLQNSQAYCIKPSHIHEAIRRYCTFVGPFTSYQSKNRSCALQLLCI